MAWEKRKIELRFLGLCAGGKESRIGKRERDKISDLFFSVSAFGFSSILTDWTATES